MQLVALLQAGENPWGVQELHVWVLDNVALNFGNLTP